MKIHKDCKLEAAASKDKSRTVLREPYLDIKDGVGTLVVTDGRILAHIPVEVTPEDTAGFVSGAVLKAARKASKRGDMLNVGLNSVATLDDGATMPRKGDADGEVFPKWREAIPADYAEPEMVVSFDAMRLWQLAQAMGTQYVRLVIGTADKPILVYPNGAARSANMDARGVIMPIKL
jgi:hypothetical protein